MGERMSSREFGEWMAFYSIEPFGEERSDLRAGVIASTIANANRDPKTRSKPFTPSEFMPSFEVEDEDDLEPLPPEELAAKFDAIFGGLNDGNHSHA